MMVRRHPSFRAALGAGSAAAIFSGMRTPAAYAQSQEVLAAQQRLNELGFDAGPEDGLWGPRTQSALTAFQTESGLPATGQLDAATTAALSADGLGTEETVAPAADPAEPAAADAQEAPEPAPAADPTPPEPDVPAVETDPEPDAQSESTDPQPPDITATDPPTPAATAAQETSETEEQPATEPAPAAEPEDDPPVEIQAVPSDPGTGQELVQPDPPSVAQPPLISDGILLAGALVLGIAVVVWLLRRRRVSSKSNGAEPASVPEAALTATAADAGPATPQTWEAGWVPDGQSATVAGREIGGMVYVGPPPRVGGIGEADNAFIDPAQSVAETGADFEGEGLHFWPNYATITPTARATYLDWLAGGRDDPRHHPGYVFLYFYGLERRVFVEQADTEERARIVAEVERLREAYGANRSVRRYLGAFLDAAKILEEPEEEPAPIFERTGYDIPALVLLAIGARAAAGVPLTSDWLLSWYLCHPETRLRNAAERAFPEFRAYFQHLFDLRFPDGLPLRVPERRLKLTYRAASGNFVADLTEIIGDVPDIASLTEPLATARELADEAAGGVDRFSRYLARNPNGRGTVEAHALLPEALWGLFPSAERDALESWAGERIGQGGFVPVEDLLTRMAGARPDKIGNRRLTDTADALARFGIGMAPDPRFASRQPKFGEPVALFALPVGAGSIEAPSDDYRAAIQNLTVATLVAHADGVAEAAEADHLGTQIAAQAGVTEAERVRLHANLRWMCAVTPDFGRLRDKLKKAPTRPQEVIRRAVLAALGADGSLAPEEVETVEQLFETLGLDKSRLHSDLHALDADRVSDAMADTGEVSQALASIFSESEAGVEPETEDTPPEDDILTGLDAAHRAVVAVLITRPLWQAEDFEALAEEHDLMPVGALETVNDWAFARFDAGLIEVRDGYAVNAAIAETLSR